MKKQTILFDYIGVFFMIGAGFVGTYGSVILAIPTLFLGIAIIRASHFLEKR